MEKYDISIIGGGILGVCISYWISNLTDLKVLVIEKESQVGTHTSSRNTGVLHSPFYLNPEKKGRLGKAAFLSHAMWKKLAQKWKLPWKTTGTMEVATDETEHKILEKYLKWGPQNGMNPDSLKLLNGNEVEMLEPNIKCHSAIHCTTDSVVDYGIFTKTLQKESENLGTKFLLNTRIDKIEWINNEPVLIFQNKNYTETKYIINCAGGYSLDIAKKFGLVSEYDSLHFRGEYWIAKQEYQNMTKTNVYSVPGFPEFPFLDPHWILRVDGRSEVGPNAVPVPSPETYHGYLGDAETLISKLTEVFTGNTKKLLLNRDFVNLISKEWLSSISKSAMIERVQKFLPMVKPGFFVEKGTAGIRTPIISPEGRFVSDVMEIEGPSSYHVLNYNSPGATGAPEYSRLVISQLQEKGILPKATRQKNPMWDITIP